MTTPAGLDPDLVAPSRPPLRLSPAETAARLTWMVLDGPHVDRDADELLRRGIGGVVLFDRNVESPEQVHHLAADLRRRASGPLRVAVDQEGGHIVRLRSPLTRFPSAMAIGATGSPALAYEVAAASARELAALGIDVALAPVVDVASQPANPTIGARAYGSRPGLTALFGAAAVRGYLDGGVLPAAKHFPGHGRTALDSHVARPTVRGGLAALARSDLLPFQAAVAAGSPLVMVSHVAYEALSHGLPASLSRAVMRSLLRHGLGFGGVALTDAMVMDAVADGRSVPEACVAALRAGADVVMPLDPQRRALREIEDGLRDGRLDETEIAESLRRVAGLDDRLRSIGAPTRDVPRHPDALEPWLASHAALATAVAGRALTLVRGSWRWPIGRDESVLLVEFASWRASPIENKSTDEGFARALGTRLPRLRAVVVRPGQDRRAAEAQAIHLARSVDLVVVASRDNGFDRESQMLANAIAAVGRPIIHVALRGPYDLAVLPSDVGVAAYSDVPASLEAVADALTLPGWSVAQRFPGVLPVTLPATVPGDRWHYLGAATDLAARSR